MSKVPVPTFPITSSVSELARAYRAIAVGSEADVRALSDELFDDVYNLITASEEYPAELFDDVERLAGVRCTSGALDQVVMIASTLRDGWAGVLKERRDAGVRHLRAV